MTTITENNITPWFSIIITKIESIIEYCKNAFKNFKTSISENKYEFLEEINNELGTISHVLKKYQNIYQSELDYFVQIKSYIIYIVGKNCEIENFGHFQSVKFLLDLFKNLIYAKFQYLKEEIPLNEYADKLKEYSLKLNDFDDYFNDNILIDEPKFNEMINQLDINMRGD